MQLNQTLINEYIDLLTAIKMPFVIEVSNYTTRITSENYNVHFLDKEQNLRVFAAAAMITKDLQSVKNPPTTKAENVNYYTTNFGAFGYGFYSDVVHNIDLKSAYATILYNDGFITGKTFDYLSKLPKMERLAAVGMCASRKDIFTHNAAGRITASAQKVNPLSSFFFYCVERTEQIIQDCKVNFLTDSFLFSWVDGMYYLNKNDGYKTLTMDYLKNHYNIESTFTLLTDFEMRIKNDFYKLSYKKDGENDVIKFNIPIPETKLKKQVINYLMSKNYKQCS